MKNLIYQCWDGNIPSGCCASQDSMSKYAKRIGAEYLFDDNARWCKFLPRPLDHFFGSFKPIYDDEFLEYDNVLIVDCDIFVVSGLTESIFDVFDADLGICTEPFQPEYRVRLNATDGAWINNENDERWGLIVRDLFDCDIPRTESGLPKVFNAGVVLWSAVGRRHAREKFTPVVDYARIIMNSGLPHFYAHDQMYLHAMFVGTGMNYVEMSNDWNNIVHFHKRGANKSLLNDPRNADTKFVHIMLKGAKDFSQAELWRITNLPSTVWRFNRPQIGGENADDRAEHRSIR